ALGGLGAGFALWAYTLLLPTLSRAGLFDGAWFETGPFGIELLRPQALFGLSGWDEITHGAFWSLLANIAGFIFLSLRFRPSVDERLQALPFLDPWMQRGAAGSGEWRGRI